VDDALYASICRTIREVRPAVQANHGSSAPVLVEWQSWAKGFVAGLYRRKSAVRAALSARSEAGILGLDDVAAGQLGHAAADLAWASVYAAAGEHEKAEALVHEARERLAAPLGPAAVAQSRGGVAPREPESRRGPGAAGERESDPATHARLLIERYGPTVRNGMRLRDVPPGAAFTHRVRCPWCRCEFELFSAPWCAHSGDPSKNCPHCERCACGHPDYLDPRLWVEAPGRFRARGFRRLFVRYL
jgi:hypothetical protein